MVNQAMVYYLSAVAVSIGFRMNLFNIGVEGQYSLAAFGAAYVGGQLTGGGPFHVVAEVLVAVLVGAAWAGIAGVLKVTRGVSEVISTIMLNAIAVGLGSYLLHKLGQSSGNNIQTKPISSSGQVPGLSYSGTQAKIFGFLFVAIAVGLAYWFIAGRTRFGFRIKATGLNEQAAVASGVNVKRMTLAGDADVRWGRRAGGPARAARPDPHLQPDRAVRAGLRRHRHRAAGSQLAGRAWRWPRCCGPSSASRPTSWTSSGCRGRSPRSCRG